MARAKAPKPETSAPPEALREYFAKMGARGGRSRSTRKRAAVRANLKRANRAREAARRKKGGTR